MDAKTLSFVALLSVAALFISGCCCCALPPLNETSPTPYVGFTPTPGGGFTPAPTPAPGENPEWTYMVYMDGDNNLEEAAIADFLEMERVGSTPNVNIVVQMDRSSGYYAGEGDWSGARRFLVQRGDGNSITSQAVQDLGETDMSSADSLYSFTSWAIDHYPAKKYALVLWNHGGGWTGLLHDEGSGNGMFLPEMKQALGRTKDKLGKKLDVVVLDMCLMAQYDVAVEVEPSADYLVASEETVPGWSFDYSMVLTDLTNRPTMAPRELALMEVDKFREFYQDKDDATTMAALDMSKVPALKAAYDGFASSLTTHVNSGKWKDIAEMHMYTENYPAGMGPEEARAFSFGDLYDFASNAEAYSANDSASMYQTAVALESAVNQTVMANYNHAKHPRSHGISYYFQPSKTIYDQILTSQYERTDVYNDPAWKGFLQAYYSQAPQTVEQPRISGFATSRSASLARPVKFSYTMGGQNIVANRWAQFYQENGEWKLARMVNQRTATTLPNGKVVYGFPGGTGEGVGSSSAVEMLISDGTHSVRASVEQLWPMENFYAVDGLLRLSSGEQADARLYFYDANGTLARIQVIQTDSNGQPSISYLPSISNGDQFTPYVYTLSTAGLTPHSSNQPLTFDSQHGFTASWRPLQSGDYMVADILMDLANQTGYAASSVHISTQPTLRPLQQTDLGRTWDCAQIEQGMRVHRVMILDLSGGNCRFEDVTGNATCTLSYSESGSIPQLLISLPGRFETYKFLASRINNSAMWLFSATSGEDPIYCFVSGSETPTLQPYRDLYSSVGDPGSDIEPQSLDPQCLLGEWESAKSNMSFSFSSFSEGEEEPVISNEFFWQIGANEISGNYSADGRILGITSVHPSPEYSTEFYYLCSAHKLVLYDQSNSELVFNRPGQPLPSAPNDPQPAVQPGGFTPQPVPSPVAQPTPPSGLVGMWYNTPSSITLLLDATGQYSLLYGYNYDFGTYAAEGNALTFNSAGGTTTRYYYSISGDTLTLQGNGGTVVLARMPTSGPP